MAATPARTSDPPAPAGKTGWPWDETPAVLPPLRPDGTPWPRFTIVTPSFNQGRFIEETIRSVLLQGYPNLEYIVMDGGSTDETLAVANRYGDRIDHLVSEKDAGQSDAINKGLAKSTGALLGWLNSDDVLMPGALAAVAIAAGDAGKPLIVAGTSEYRDVTGGHCHFVLEQIPRDRGELFGFARGLHFAQPSVFFTRAALDAVGEVRRDLYYTMDLDLWIRMAGAGPIVPVPNRLSWMRQHDEAKTTSDSVRALDEAEQVLRAHAGSQPSAHFRQTLKDLADRRARDWAYRGHAALLAGDRKAAMDAAWRAVRANAAVISKPVWLTLAKGLVSSGGGPRR